MMMKRLIMCLVLVTPLLCSAQEEENSNICEIRTDGIYVAYIDDNTNSYLRFFDDATAMNTVSQNSIESASKFMTYHNKSMMLNGHYSVGRCNVYFKGKSEAGKMVFEGKIEEDYLELVVKNLNQSASTKQTYDFYPFNKEELSNNEAFLD